MKKIGIVFISLFFTFVSTEKIYAQVDVGVGVSIGIAPVLPVYSQPPCPVDGYLWTPGYWAYGDDGYYWVPGVWVLPPQPGFLWTPCYWGFSDGLYGWHAGYWGTHVGFYGGINYGYGYGGYGYGGGMWQGGSFRYNTAVTNVNRTVIHNTYVNNRAISHVSNRVSFNGAGGVTARPRPDEETAMHEQHVQATSEQQAHQQTASRDRNQFASVNHGRPATAAMNKVGGSRFNQQGRPANTLVNNHPAVAHNNAVINNHQTNMHNNTTTQNHQSHISRQGSMQSHPQISHTGGQTHQAQFHPQSHQASPHMGGSHGGSGGVPHGGGQHHGRK